MPISPPNNNMYDLLLINVVIAPINLILCN